ncbi:MAG: hypothetical protein O6943_11285 [Bacteroidetes bacterium]|nr:hypothetical protein [Bacteroidota bacterium]
MRNSRPKSQWGLLKEAMEGKHSKRFNAILHTCDDIEFAKNFIKLLEFVQPKLARAEVSNDAEDQVITIVHAYPLSQKN